MPERAQGDENTFEEPKIKPVHHMKSIALHAHFPVALLAQTTLPPTPTPTAVPTPNAQIVATAGQTVNLVIQPAGIPNAFQSFLDWEKTNAAALAAVPVVTTFAAQVAASQGQWAGNVEVLEGTYEKNPTQANMWSLVNAVNDLQTKIIRARSFVTMPLSLLARRRRTSPKHVPDTHRGADSDRDATSRGRQVTA